LKNLCGTGANQPTLEKDADEVRIRGKIKSNSRQFLTPRLLLGIPAGAALAILLSLFMPNTGLATLLGLLLAVSVANLEKPINP
jgi:hypothetical protein